MKFWNHAAIPTQRFVIHVENQNTHCTERIANVLE
jgi:hypothetical protein